MSEIEESLKKLLLFAINIHCPGVSISLMTLTTYSPPTYLARQSWIIYMEKIILRS